MNIVDGRRGIKMNKHCRRSNKQTTKNAANTKNTRKFCDQVYGNSRFENILQENFCFNSILNVMVNPVACNDRNGLYLFVNRAFETLVGLPAKEIVGYTRLEICKKISEKAEGRISIKEDCF